MHKDIAEDDTSIIPSQLKTGSQVSGLLSQGLALRHTRHVSLTTRHVPPDLCPRLKSSAVW